MRRVTLMSLAVLVVLLSACDNPNTTDYDPMGKAADAAGMTLTDVPQDQITSCVESTQYGAFLGDADALERWQTAGQSEAALADACLHIGRNDPEALATMHWNWTTLRSTLPDPG
jgi:hypothetical protein